MGKNSVLKLGEKEIENAEANFDNALIGYFVNRTPSFFKMVSIHQRRLNKASNESQTSQYLSQSPSQLPESSFSI